MHLSSSKFEYNSKSKVYLGYCGDFNPQIPKWSNLQLRTINPEHGVYFYLDGEIIRYSLIDTLYKNEFIDYWEFLPLPSDKKDFPHINGTRLIIMNNFKPKK